MLLLGFSTGSLGGGDKIMKSKFRLILIGGWSNEEQKKPDLHGRTEGEYEYKRNAGILVLTGIFCYFLAALILLPSSIGFIPIEYDEIFLSSDSCEQYFKLLLLNSLIVLKSAFGIELVNSTNFPNIPETTLGYLLIIFIAVLNILAILCTSAGLYKIGSNLNTWNKNKQE